MKKFRLFAMIRSSVLTVLLILLSIYLSAQSLPRKIDFGIDYLNLPDGKGIEVKNVYRDHMADKMGLMPNDVIQKFGGIDVPHMGALLFWIDKKDIGDIITLIIKRGGKRKIVSGNVLSKPFENDDYTTYDAFNIKGGTIRTIVSMPPGGKNVPVIFYIQDYSCLSMDYAGRDYDFVKKLSDEFVKNGYAFVRVEKHGVGDSRTDKNCMVAGFKEEGAIFESGMKYVKNLKGIDPDKITILAHGLGGNQILNAIKKTTPLCSIFWGYYNNMNKEECLSLRSDKYWKEILQSSKQSKWGVIKFPTLFYHPEFDDSDNEGKEAKELSDFLQKLNQQSTYSIYPDANHLYQKVTSDDYPNMFIDGFVNPGFFAENFNSTIVPTFIDWIEKQ